MNYGRENHNWCDFSRTSRKKLKTATGEIDDENEHDAAELGFMFEAADDDQEDDEEEVDWAVVINYFMS